MKLYMCGPGGFEIQPSPESDVFDLEESEHGHLLLPCGIFPNKPWEEESKIDLSCMTFAALFENPKAHVDGSSNAPNHAPKE